jgi:hypothetical protein
LKTMNEARRKYDPQDRLLNDFLRGILS